MTKIEINGEAYPLRLTTTNLIDIEEKLGYNPIEIFMGMRADKLPKLKDMLIVLHGSLQSLNHGINFIKTCELFDKWCQEGHNQFDLIPLFLDVFTESGFLNGEEEEESKNA